MRPLIFKCPPLMFFLIIVGAMAPFAVFPFIQALDWPPATRWILAGVAFFMILYAVTLLPTKLVLSDDGLYQKQLFSELKLPWSEIAEWRYVRVRDVERFWIRDRRGKKYDLKTWLVFGKRRSRQLAGVMREKGIVGCEEYDG